MKHLLFMVLVLFINPAFGAAQATTGCESDMLIAHHDGYMRLDAAGDTRPFITDATLAARVTQLFPSSAGAAFAAITQHADQSQIVILDATGTLERTLLTCPHVCRWVDWSPDETQLVYVDFAEAEGYTWQLYLINRDGTGARLLLETQTFDEGAFVHSVWSRDGRILAYELVEPLVQRRIFLYDLDTDTHEILLPPETGKSEGLLGWSRDGDAVLLWSDRERGGIFRARLDSHDLEHLSLLRPGAVGWSPNGEQVVFFGAAPGQRHIYTMEYATGRTTQLTQTGVIQTDGDARPVWSPDGQHIIFQMWADETYALFSMKANGEGLTRLPTASNAFVAWLGCE